MDNIAGYCCLAGLVVSWVAQSEVAQYVQTSASYNKPYFIVWCNHGGMALVLPCQELWQRYQRSRRRAAQAAAIAALGPGSPCQRPDVDEGREALLPSSELNGGGAEGLVDARCSSEALPWYRSALLDDLRAMHGIGAMWLAQRSLALAWVYTVGDWVWYIGLPHTSVTVGTCVFNSSCVFTYAFSVLLLGMAFSRARVMAVLVSLAGVVVLAAFPGTNHASGNSAHGGSGGDTDPGSNSQFVGIIFVLMAAIAYALCVVAFCYGVLRVALILSPHPRPRPPALVLTRTVSTLLLAVWRLHDCVLLHA